MPLLKVEYDDAVLTETEARDLCLASQKIVKQVTGIEATFVYGNPAHIKIDVPPVEVWVEMSEHKIQDSDALLQQIGEALQAWKQETSYPHPINLVLVPMSWKIQFDI
jgi:hypothetical protein